MSLISTTPPLSADNSDYCSGGGIGGVYRSLVMTLGYFKLEQFVALKLSMRRKKSWAEK